MDHYYKALKRNMMLTIIIVSFIPVFFVSSTIYYQFRNSYREKVIAHLQELVKKHQQRIDDFLKEKLAEVKFLAVSFSLIDLSDEAFLKEKLITLHRGYSSVFVDLGVVDSQGKQIAYAGPFSLGEAFYAEMDWFQKAMKYDYVISDVFLGLRGLPHFIVAVKQVWKGQPWILRATIDFVAFNRLVESIRIGETGFAFILNKQGEFQTKPSYDFQPSSGCYGHFYNCEQEAAIDGIYTEERFDDSGVKSLYLAAFLKDKDWLLVYKQVSADALSGLSHAQNIAIIIFILGGVAIITMAFVLSRHTVKHIVLADREKEMMNKQVIETGKLASVGELAAGIAHEINNPVAIMVEEAGWVGDLLEEEEFEKSENLDEFQRALKQINTQGKRCKEITHKLLSFARKTDSRIQAVQVNELIEDVVSLSAQRARYSNVDLRTNFQHSLPTIQASLSEMQQVFLNLINNALDAMEKDGGAIEITSKLQDSQVIVDIADTGPGIPKSNLARIFDPFFTTKPVGKGTGLGLSICYGIINKMGGEIDVKSSVGLGTTFSIRIPVENTDSVDLTN
ncbi:MAG: ATP-binding protein [Thermodesulfobacteriota bacterium]|nr:ATP-binding protein [Thermodesulfobacteriota bacterium]